MFKDPIVEEVRKTRREIEAELGNDPAKYVQHLREVQERYRDRLVRRKPVPAVTAKAESEET